jgi:trk system potassium uptake protein TrkA
MGNSYAILGLGSFGSKLAVSLSKLGNTVLVCDIDPARVDDMRDKVAEAVIKVAEKKIMPRGRINKSDADALTANIIKSIKGSTTDTTEG